MIIDSQGAFDQEHVYTQLDVNDLIKFARLRGVRVVPEFDTPVCILYRYCNVVLHVINFLSVCVCVCVFDRVIVLLGVRGNQIY